MLGIWLRKLYYFSQHIEYSMQIMISLWSYNICLCCHRRWNKWKWRLFWWFPRWASTTRKEYESFELSGKWGWKRVESIEPYLKIDETTTIWTWTMVAKMEQSTRRPVVSWNCSFKMVSCLVDGIHSQHVSIFCRIIRWPFAFECPLFCLWDVMVSYRRELMDRFLIVGTHVSWRNAAILIVTRC